MLEFLALGEGGVSRQGVKANGTGLTFDQAGIDLEPGEIGRVGAGRLAADDIDLGDLAPPSSREATFTSSPIAEKSKRRSDTRLPTQHSPELGPMPKRTGLNKRSSSSACLRAPSFRSRSVRRIASAAPTACLA